MARKKSFESKARDLCNKLVDDLRPLLQELVRQELENAQAEANREQAVLYAPTDDTHVSYEFVDGGTLGENATARVLTDTIPPEATGVVEISLDDGIPVTEPPPAEYVAEAWA